MTNSLVFFKSQCLYDLDSVDAAVQFRQRLMCMHALIIIETNSYILNGCTLLAEMLRYLNTALHVPFLFL